MVTAREKTKRKPAALDRQLSALQRSILVWLAEKQGLSQLWDQSRKHRESGGSERDFWKSYYPLLKELRSKGVAWSAKRFYKDAPSRGQETALSKALHRLEKRGLVSTYDTAEGVGFKQRTSHAKLTRTGEKAAHLLIMNHGMSQRELHTLPRAEIRRRSALWVAKGFLSRAETGHESIEKFFQQQGRIYILGPGGFDPKAFVDDKAIFLRIYDELVASLRSCFTELDAAKTDLTRVDTIIRGVVWFSFGHSVAATDEEIQNVIPQLREGELLPFSTYVLAVMTMSIMANILPGYD